MSTNEIINLLNEKGIYPQQAWLNEQMSNSGVNFNSVYKNFLTQNISETNIKSPDFSSLTSPKIITSKPYAVQIDEIVDISLEKEKRTNFRQDQDGTLKLLLNNGGQHFIGIEKKKLNNITTLTPIGSKLRIEKGSEVRYGVLFLTPENSTLLGGTSPDLIEKRQNIYSSGKRNTNQPSVAPQPRISQPQQQIQDQQLQYSPQQPQTIATPHISAVTRPPITSASAVHNCSPQIIPQKNPQNSSLSSNLAHKSQRKPEDNQRHDFFSDSDSDFDFSESDHDTFTTPKKSTYAQKIIEDDNDSHFLEESSESPPIEITSPARQPQGQSILIDELLSKPPIAGECHSLRAFVMDIVDLFTTGNTFVASVAVNDETGRTETFSISHDLMSHILGMDAATWQNRNDESQFQLRDMCADQLREMAVLTVLDRGPNPADGIRFQVI